MFPNSQDALPLPRRPNLEQYKKLAKDLVKAFKSAEPDAIHAWAMRWVETLAKLSEITITPELPVRIDRWIDQVADFARKKLSPTGKAKCALADAQFVIARSHGFESWPKFVQHIEALTHASCPACNFETAADAIVSGDVATLDRLLRADPELIRARSAREHRATLLHYISANGVEGYRQKTPKNSVQVAEVLLDAGAEVDAEADVYGGGATALALVATSVHPERAGVQEDLMALLLRHGAKIHDDKRIVNACLANGRGRAAEFLADRGARLDLEAAAGIGRLDAVRIFFSKDGTPQPPATQAQMQRGFLWACEYGRNDVVEFLLQKGVDLQTHANTGQTALHWAVIGGQLDTIKLLIAHGASLEEKNTYGGTALGQALWSAVNGGPEVDHLRLIEALIAAGAKVKADSLTWLARQETGSSSLKQLIAERLNKHIEHP
jgi:hypothetical protein